MPPETPLAFGLHPNAEIGFKLREAETFCNSLVQLQPRESGGGTGCHCWCLCSPAVSMCTSDSTHWRSFIGSVTDLLACLLCCVPCVCVCVSYSGEGGMSLEERAKMVMDEMVDKLPEVYNMEDIRAKVEEVTPYVMVAIQVGTRH